MSATPRIDFTGAGVALAPVPRIRERPSVKGKFLYQGEEKLYIKGVTYGPFRPSEDGSEYHTSEIVDRDFSAMAAAGMNAVRVYTVPPRWLLDLAGEHGLLVLAGLPWEQHITFLDDAARMRAIEQRVREGVRSLAAHPALLGVTIGNEIPASIVRWHGRKRIESFLHRLYDATKSEDSGALATYVNFPTTEYLELDFLDFNCFNVYLENEERLRAYLARLQNLAGEKPLVMAEIGLDSLRNGWRKQATTLGWQIRNTFAGGAAGLFVFAWTDEWHRGGNDINDWDFGLTTRKRDPKPSLESVQQAFSEVPVSLPPPAPHVSVVVCSFNGARTIADTLDHLSRLEYPNFEVIVVSDGSTDGTAEIARGYDGVRVIEVPNGGLSAARNIGRQTANGEIIAYIDDDAYPDPHWLHYLAQAFESTNHAAIGGPNLPPNGDGRIAECVARAPGGPVHVLITDELAEHIPGCNFAVRKSALHAIGGFDPIFRAAGDDVDVCWRLQEKGLTIGFHPTAVVWHHRRNSLRNYWRQQRGYGKAEALLERKWPEKYNESGHVSWAGRLYGAGLMRSLGLRQRVYHGAWNSAPFQSLYHPAGGLWQALPQMPEWYLVNLLLLGLCALGLSWPPLLWLGPVAAVSVLLPLGQVVASVSRTKFTSPSLRFLTMALYILQPIARLWGRMTHGLTPWRRRSAHQLVFGAFTKNTWSEKWRDAADWLNRLRGKLQSHGAEGRPGGDFDSWDLEIRGGLLGAARLRLAVEEHGGGKQMFRCYVWPTGGRLAICVPLLLSALAIAAAMQGSRIAAIVLLAGLTAVVWRIIFECGAALGTTRAVLDEIE